MKLIKHEYCPITAGVNCLDQIRILENLNEITFKRSFIPITFFTIYKQSV